MAFCRNCGAQMQDGARFCPSCGSEGAQSAGPAPAQQSYGAQAQSGSNDTVMGVLAYLWLLVLVPIFAAKDSPFARYHANQGLVLAIAEVAYWILTAILNAIFWAISWRIAAILSTVFWLISLVFLVLAVIGIVNVVGGKQKPLPVIGGITILK